MSGTGGTAASESRSGEERVAPLTRSASSNPVSWALQFGISASSAVADIDPFIVDPPLPEASPPRSPTMASSSGEEIDLFSLSDAAKAADPAASASSAASFTPSPQMLSRYPQPPPRDEDDGDWGESSLDGHDSSVSCKKLLISEASSDLASLKQLMRQGSWRDIVDMVNDIRTRPVSKAPDEQVVYTTYHLLALMKLRNYAAAQDELFALGDLNSPNFRFEKRPSFYPSKSGSMVPFGLRWIHAELPHRLGQTSTTIDRLYDLLAHCNERIDFLHKSVKRLSPERERAVNTNSTAPPRNQDQATILPEDVDKSSTFIGDHNEKSQSPMHEPATSDGALSNFEDVGSNFIPSEILDDDFGDFVTSVLDKNSSGDIVYATLIQRWIRRQEVVLCSVLGHHLDHKDFIVCLTRLEDLVRKRPQDVVVLSKYGYVQLQLGDLYGARRSFATIEAICEQQGRTSSPGLASLLSRNRGLLYFSLKQYTKAVKEFDVVLEIDPGDIVSANNKALCLMYSRDLVGATEVLETVLQSSPITALNETLVLNLCSMYELASMNSVESKKTLSSWILRIAPDDFDLTCTRL